MRRKTAYLASAATGVAVDFALPWGEARAASYAWAGADHARGAAEATPPVVGDCTRFADVLENLVSNALKLTPPGGRVDVRVELPLSRRAARSRTVQTAA